MADEAQVLARLPYPSTEPKQLAVASEVATLARLRAHGLPVPRVHAYSPDANNPAGSEYIIMEKLSGRPLGDCWFDLSDKQRLKVLLQLVQLEAKLYNIGLPASGSIYYGRDLLQTPHVLPSRARSSVSVPMQLFNGGFLSVRRFLSTAVLVSILRMTHHNPHQVPGVKAIDALRNPALKELAWLRAYGRSRFPFQRAYRESMEYRLPLPSEHMHSLETYLKIASELLPSDDGLLRPILHHPDLQPNNIFVSDDLDIVGLIDWQHASVLPLFLASGIPKFFQNYDDPESIAFYPPPRPDLTGMDEGERADALADFRRRHTHFFYLGFAQRFNEPHFRAIDQSTNMLTRRIFNHAGEPWEGNNVPLQADLVLVTKVPWDKYSTIRCPISFTLAEAESIMRLQSHQEEVDMDLKRICNATGMSVDGWTSLEGYEAASALARQMKIDGLASLDNEYDREMTDRHWPFDDHDENE